jgi:hypothetical protein
MTITTFNPPTQDGLVTGNPYAISFLRVTLSDWGWSFQRLAALMSWEPETFTEFGKLALGLGLIKHMPVAEPIEAPIAAKKAKPVPLPETAEDLVLPELLRPSEPVIAPQAKPATQHEPASWEIMEVLSQAADQAPLTLSEREPASWITTMAGDACDGQ